MTGAMVFQTSMLVFAVMPMPVLSTYVTGDRTLSGEGTGRPASLAKTRKMPAIGRSNRE